MLTFDDLAALEAEGAAFKREHPQALDDAVAAIGEEDLFTFIYTSGTTGPAEGLHDQASQLLRDGGSDRSPAAVRAEQRPDAPVPAAGPQLRPADAPDRRYVGYTIAFLPDPLQTAAALQQVRPTVLPSVPRVYEKIHTAVVSAIDETSGASAGWPTGRLPSAGA